MSQGNLAKNTTFFTTALALQKILSFVYFIFVARALGVANTGKYSFALSFTAIFAMVLDFGTNQILIRESAKNHDNSQKYLANVLGLKTAAAALVYAAIVIAVNLLGYPEITRQLVYLSGLVMLLDSFSLSFFSVLRGRQNLLFESWGVVGNQFLVLASGLVIIKLGWGILPLMGAYIIGSLFNFLFASFWLRRRYNIKANLAFNRSIIKEIITLALPFAIAGCFIRVYSYSDTILLSKLSTDTAVGLYSVAYKITFALQFVATAFSASLYPAFCHYFAQEKQKLASAFTKSLNYLMLLALPVSLGVIAVSREAVVLAFGQSYLPAVEPLNIMMLSLIFIFLYFPVGALLNAGNKQTLNTIFLGLTALINIIANLILIPWLDYNGAAWATVISQGFLFLAGLSQTPQLAGYRWRDLGLVWWKIFLASGLMFALCLGLKNWLPALAIIPVAALSYFVLLYLLKIFTLTEIKNLSRLIFQK